MLLWLSLLFQGSFLDFLLILLAAVFQLSKLISFLVVSCQSFRLTCNWLGFQLWLVCRSFCSLWAVALRTSVTLWSVALWTVTTLWSVALRSVSAEWSVALRSVSTLSR